MNEKLLSDFFLTENIRYYSCLDISECDILYPKKLPEYTKSVCFFLIPYFCKDEGNRNVSLYAVPKDYHLYVNKLSDRFGEMLRSSDASFEYRFFADNCPFCERTCTEKAKLGKKGKNGLLINPEYGSYVFIGCVCLPFSISITQTAENFKCDLCENCEKCKTFCPISRNKCSECLSAITQKKKITGEESEIIASFPVKWGCDICQTVCPYNQSISDTPIEFFRRNRIPYLTEKTLSAMTDEEFFSRAYSWRGRETIKRNLLL